MASEVDIYNIALAFCGAEPVMDPLQLSTNAKILLAQFPTTRDAVLRAHPWNCAMARAVLAKNATAPAWGFDNQYTLPADPYCLRVYRLEEPDADYQVEGRRLLTNEGPPLRILYIARVIDTEQFDALLVQAIGARLAFAANYKLTRNAGLTAKAWDWYRDILAEARSMDGQEGSPEEFAPSEWLDARS